MATFTPSHVQSAQSWRKKASTLWTIPIEKLAPPPGVPAPVPFQPLPATIVETSALVPESGRLARQALDYVQWNTVPPLAATERTAWVKLDSPTQVSSSVIPKIESLKLKGVGLGDLNGAIQPSGNQYEDELRHDHVGFTPQGEFCILPTPPAPYGAMFLHRAIAEFRNAEILLKAGCPSIVPVAVYRYETIHCGWNPDKPFGAVVCGAPTAQRLRVSGLFVADPGRETEHEIACAHLLELFGPDRLGALTKVSIECGRTLREFHEAGLFQYNGYPTNYIIDTGSRRVCLVDLDSSRSLQECTPAQRGLEILRDVAGWLFNLGIMMMEPSVTIRFPPSSLAAGRHFQRLLEAYFAEVDSVPSVSIDPFLEHFWTRYEQLYARREEIATSPEGEAILNQLWPSRPFSYAMLVAGLAGVYGRTSLAQRCPLPCTAQEVAARAKRFLDTNPTTRW